MLTISKLNIQNCTSQILAIFEKSIFAKHSNYLCLSQFQALPTPKPRGIWPKIMPKESGFAHTNCIGRPGFDKGWDVANIQHTRLIPTQSRLFDN